MDARAGETASGELGMDEHGPSVLLPCLKHIQKGKILHMLPLIHQALEMQHPELGPRGTQEGGV